MAQYPEGNPGVHPIDPTTAVGEFRYLYGDTESEPYDPEVPGIQNYEELSDAEIESLLRQGEGSVSRAVGYRYIRLAGKAAKESREVSDYDLRVNTTKRAADLRAMAQMWFDRADEEEEQSGGGDFFDVFFSPSCRCARTPELATRPCLCRGR